MAQPSPGRFLALWTSTAVGVALLSHLAGLAFEWRPDGTERAFGFRFFFYSYGIDLLATILLGCLQARILAVHRRRVPWWALATALGWVGGGLLSGLANQRIMQWALSVQSETLALWILVPFWAVTGALSQGVTQAFALWGRRWKPEAVQWLAGLTLVHLLAAAVWPLLWRTTDSPLMAALFRNFASVLLSSAIAAAGTAWLLDRTVFRAAPAEAPTA